jgi:phage-related protein
VSYGAVKTSFTVKVTDNFAPKSIKIFSDKKDNKVASNDIDGIGIGTLVSPTRPYADENVTFTIDSTDKVYFENDLTKAKKSWAADENGSCVLIPKGPTGTVKVTAKTYNGKKASLKVTITNPYEISKVEMYGLFSKETYVAELYADYQEDHPTDPKKNTLVLIPQLYYKVDGVHVPLETIYDPDYYNTYDYEMASVKWSSSNKKVATIEIMKGIYGYSQDELFLPSGEIYDGDKMDYGALVKIKGTGTTTLTAKSRDGKKSFSIKLKVVDSHKVTDIFLPSGSKVTVPVGKVLDLDEYFVVYPTDYYGKVTVTPSHSTSKIEVLGGTVIRTEKTGEVVMKIKAGDKTKKFTLKIK